MSVFAFRPYLLMIWALVLVILSAMGVEPIALAVMGTAATILVVIVSFLWPRKWQIIDHRMFRNAVAVPLSLLLIASVMLTQWPLRLQYLLVKPSLNTIANRVEKDESIQTPIQVGFLRIKNVEINRHGVVCLWTDPNPGGYSGLVKTQPSKVASEFNLWSSVKLDDTWQFIHED